MTFWITLGQAHAHVLNGRTVDHNVVIEIEADDYPQAMRKANEWFGDQYANIYPQKPDMKYYPGGIVKTSGGAR